MTLTLVPLPPADDLAVHVIPVPVNMTVEESWSLIKRGVFLVHPLGEPSWRVVLVDEDDEIVEDVT